ncbi:MAG TPA: hypothetical protein VKI44_19970 [Acetobacteraceae bacterium]|nr:hypothetical protein [Acetobacteraceae bacterium]
MASEALPPGDRPDNVELGLILGNTTEASRDAKAALDATLRSMTTVVGRLTGVEARIGGLEARFTALEDRAAGIERGIDELARSNHRIEQILADVQAKLAG